MQLKVLSSGSHGNCYILQANDGSRLLIECGIHIKKILKGIDYQLNSVVACLVSHSHSDHTFALDDLQKAGVTVIQGYVSKSQSSNVPKFQSSNVSKPASSETNGLRNNETTEYGNIQTAGDFRFISFPLEHDVPCVGYLIYHPEMGTLFFATDTCIVPTIFQHCNHILIEANYEDSILQERVRTKISPKLQLDRLPATHLEVTDTLRTLRAMGTEETKEIVLIHLSKRNADPEIFQQLIQRGTGCKTYVAKENLCLILNS